jgi:hypothetical protein
MIRNFEITIAGIVAIYALAVSGHQWIGGAVGLPIAIYGIWRTCSSDRV